MGGSIKKSVFRERKGWKSTASLLQPALTTVLFVDNHSFRKAILRITGQESETSISKHIGPPFSCWLSEYPSESLHVSSRKYLYCFPFFALIRSISSSMILPNVRSSRSRLSMAATDLSANAVRRRGLCGPVLRRRRPVWTKKRKPGRCGVSGRSIAGCHSSRRQRHP